MSFPGTFFIGIAGGYANAIAGYVAGQCQNVTTYERCIELISKNRHTLSSLSVTPDFLRGYIGAMSGYVVMRTATILYHIPSADLPVTTKVKETLRGTAILVAGAYITFRMFS